MNPSTHKHQHNNTTPHQKAQQFQLADIFKAHGKEYLLSNKHKLSKKQGNVMYAIEHCRDGSFGYHVDACNKCGHKEAANNSCRDRHCPQCNSIASKRWVNKRLEEMLPIPYYHCVFTLPHVFFSLSLFNKKLFYDLLFSSASKTLLTFGEDPKWLGAKIGFYGILHTWGGKLWQHLHLHFIVTGGGMSKNGSWVPAKHNKSKFLFPVKALSKVFRGKFIDGLKKAHKNGELVFPEDMKALEDKAVFEQWMFHNLPKDWVVYAKAPFKGAEEVIKYIGRYSHRVAISNQRIISIDDEHVVFKFKNYQNNSQWEEARLHPSEFIKRFLMFHVLPNRFHRIRHFGVFANGKCKENIKKARSILKSTATVTLEDVSKIICPKCKAGHMITAFVMNAFGRFILKPFAGINFDSMMPIEDTS